jgi:hypothetical protein
MDQAGEKPSLCHSEGAKATEESLAQGKLLSEQLNCIYFIYTILRGVGRKALRDPSFYSG